MKKLSMYKKAIQGVKQPQDIKLPIEEPLIQPQECA